MRYIQTIPIGDDQFVSSTLDEDDYDDYDAGETVTAGVRRQYAHNVYEALEGPGGANVGHTPDAPSSESWWVKVGPTNRWAMFDARVNSQSTSPTDTLTVVIKPGDFVTDLVLLNVHATSATITMRDGLAGSVVFAQTVSLDETIITDWYEYYYSPYAWATEKLITGLPLYVNGHITIELTHDSDTYCALGGLVVGVGYDMGKVLRGTEETEGIDYDTIETNDFGITSIVDRDGTKGFSCTVTFLKEYRYRFYQLMRDAGGRPGVWVEPNESLLTVFGVRKDYRIKGHSDLHYECSFSVMGFI